jgi:rubrerythrin
MEAYTYYSCAEQESNPRLKAIWERFLDYEIGHLNYVSRLIEQYEHRDPQQILGKSLPKPVEFNSQRKFVRQVLAQEVDLGTNGEHFVSSAEESPASKTYREKVNAQGSPSDVIAAGYQWALGTELKRTLASV